MRIKTIYTAALLAATTLLAGCYDDKGGNDYDTTLPDVVMTIPEDVYSGSLGDSIIIKPKIETTIDASDLEYTWEVNGARHNANKRNFFTSMLPADKQGKELHYYCHLDSNITSLSTQYTCRLHAHQKSTGRDFYSSNTFKLTIEGLTGLMVLHGDDNSFDLGILRADEFMPSSSGNPDKPVATPTLYSGNNNGQKLSGKAESVMQIYPRNVYGSNLDRLEIAVQSSTGYSFLSNENFAYQGDWMHLFYLKGDKKLNANKPEGLMNNGQTILGFDDGEIFMCNELGTYPFLKPLIGKNTVCGDGNTYSFTPMFSSTGISSTPQAIGYVDHVNGKAQKGFVLFNYFSEWGDPSSEAKLMDTKDDNVKFNPSNMHADVKYITPANQNEVKAVLKGDADNSKYPGKYFAICFDFSGDGGGESGFLSYVSQLWDLSSEPDIDNAFAFAFGTTDNLCYYATPNGVYNYGVDGSTLYTAKKIVASDGNEVQLKGQVTMMKLLDSHFPVNISLKNEDPVLLVATWDGSESHLYAMHLSDATGQVTKISLYDKSTVDNWAFGKIYDANVKAL
jgi:hypothetical protein